MLLLVGVGESFGQNTYKGYFNDLSIDSSSRLQLKEIWLESEKIVNGYFTWLGTKTIPRQQTDFPKNHMSVNTHVYVELLDTFKATSNIDELTKEMYLSNEITGLLTTSLGINEYYRFLYEATEDSRWDKKKHKEDFGSFKKFSVDSIEVLEISLPKIYPHQIYQTTDFWIAVNVKRVFKIEWEGGLFINTRPLIIFIDLDRKTLKPLKISQVGLYYAQSFHLQLKDFAIPDKELQEAKKLFPVWKKIDSSGISERRKR